MPAVWTELNFMLNRVFGLIARRIRRWEHFARAVLGVETFQKFPVYSQPHIGVECNGGGSAGTSPGDGQHHPGTRGSLIRIVQNARTHAPARSRQAIEPRTAPRQRLPSPARPTSQGKAGGHRAPTVPHRIRPAHNYRTTAQSRTDQGEAAK